MRFRAYAGAIRISRRGTGESNGQYMLKDWVSGWTGLALGFVSLDLIQRLAQIKIKDKTLNKELDRLIERFNDGTHIRNEFNHCMYTVDSSGEISQTQSMRLVQTSANLRFGETKPLDDARVNEMTEAVREMTRLNRDIWDFLPRLEAHLRS